MRKSGTMSGVDDPAGRARFAAEAMSPRPRRMTPPSWLNLRLVLGIALVLGSVVAGARLITAVDHTYPRIAVRRDLAAGTILTSDDLTVARVRLPGSGAAAYVSRARDAIGKQLSWSLSAGELLPVGILAVAAPQTTLTVPVAAGAAPELRKGERIELWVSTSACLSTVLLPDVTVQAVRPESDASFSSGADGQDVVISVAPPLADRVVHALTLDEARLRAGVLVGTGPAESGALPDLLPCAEPTR